MIVLDTNVVSEAMGDNPAAHLVAWSRTVHPSELYLTTVTRAEIRYGIERLPAGRRRTVLEAAADRQFDAAAERTLAFDGAAADLYGVIVAERERSGRPISHQDAQIAAIARARGAAVATRNVKDFEHTGVRVINPFGA